jgi:hypothetical protein
MPQEDTMTSDRRRPRTWDDLFPKRFLNAESFLGKQVTLTISDLYLDDLPKGDRDDEQPGAKQETEEHAILCFKQTKREMKLNYTNGCAFRELFGDDPTKWIGHRVTLFPTKARFGREQVDAIRVWGSPELDADRVFELRLPRRKPQKITLHAVKGQHQAQEQETKHDPEPEPEQHGDAWEGPDDG